MSQYILEIMCRIVIRMVNVEWLNINIHRIYKLSIWTAAIYFSFEGKVYIFYNGNIQLIRLEDDDDKIPKTTISLYSSWDVSISKWKGLACTAFPISINGLVKIFDL